VRKRTARRSPEENGDADNNDVSFWERGNELAYKKHAFRVMQATYFYKSRLSRNLFFCCCNRFLRIPAHLNKLLCF
jgi:hypothetical protein